MNKISNQFCLLVFLFFNITNVFAQGDGQLKTSEQITKDLIVTGTRGFVVQPKQDVQKLSHTDPMQKGDEGRVDVYIHFEFARATLTDDSKQQLIELAKAMKDERLAGDSFLIAGHTDSKGADSYNKDLSEKRAKSVVEYLTTSLSVAGDRLIAQGFGERFLKDKVNPGSEVNRRVEVVNTRVLK